MRWSCHYTMIRLSHPSPTWTLHWLCGRKCLWSYFSHYLPIKPSKSLPVLCLQALPERSSAFPRFQGSNRMANVAFYPHDVCAHAMFRIRLVSITSAEKFISFFPCLRTCLQFAPHHHSPGDKLALSMTVGNPRQAFTGSDRSGRSKHLAAGIGRR